MRRLLIKLRHWYRNLRNPPAVVIYRSGTATPRPQVIVDVACINGCQGVYQWDDTEQGNACATLYGRGLAEIARLRLIDERA